MLRMVQKKDGGLKYTATPFDSSLHARVLKM
jgi:hypothetical protein